MKIEDFDENISSINVENREEIFVINVNDNTDDLLLNDLFSKNPFRPYKYYVTKNLYDIIKIATMVEEIDNNVFRRRCYESDS